MVRWETATFVWLAFTSSRARHFCSNTFWRKSSRLPKKRRCLEMFFRRRRLPKSILAEFARVVYSWDYLQDCYYVRFCTHAGHGQSTAGAKGYGSVGENPEDHSTLGAILFAVELSLNPLFGNLFDEGPST